jgi:hypothetical protein
VIIGAILITNLGNLDQKGVAVLGYFEGQAPPAEVPDLRYSVGFMGLIFASWLGNLNRNRILGFSFTLIQRLIVHAIVITIVGFIEAVIVSREFAKKHRYQLSGLKPQQAQLIEVGAIARSVQAHHRLSCSQPRTGGLWPDQLDWLGVWLVYIVWLADPIVGERARRCANAHGWSGRVGLSRLSSPVCFFRLPTARFILVPGLSLR